MKDTQSLSEALRNRARWLADGCGHSLEYGWGDKSSVIASLYEFADVVDSWSGEYLSKEETYKENQRRRWCTTKNASTGLPSMTMEERRAAVKNIDLSDKM